MNKLFTVCLGLAVFASVAQADYTSIGNPFLGELGHEQILEGIYGQDFSASGLDFVGSSITAARVEDTGKAGTMGIVNPDLNAATDGIFHDGFLVAEARAKYTVLPGQEIGFYLGASGGSFQKLFDVEGFGFNITSDSSTNLIAAQGHTWRWAHRRDGLFSDPEKSSYQNDNFQNRDYMATYLVSGLNDGWTTWVMFWEDFTSHHGDFNDVVIEVKATNSVPAPVPVPGAVMLGIVGLPLISWVKRRYAA